MQRLIGLWASLLEEQFPVPTPQGEHSLKVLPEVLEQVKVVFKMPESRLRSLTIQTHLKMTFIEPEKQRYKGLSAKKSSSHPITWWVCGWGGQEGGRTPVNCFDCGLTGCM